MTDRERQFAALGFEYAEGIDRAKIITVPSTGREIHRVAHGWEAQPWNAKYYRIFADLLDAVRFATRPELGGTAVPRQFADAKALPVAPI